MAMDYSLSSFQHSRHFLDFHVFGPKRCTIALCLFKIFGFLENATKRFKTTCYMTMDYSLSSFQHFRHFLDFQELGSLTSSQNYKLSVCTVLHNTNPYILIINITKHRHLNTFEQESYGVNTPNIKVCLVTFERLWRK